MVFVIAIFLVVIISCKLIVDRVENKMNPINKFRKDFEKTLQISKSNVSGYNNYVLTEKSHSIMSNPVKQFEIGEDGTIICDSYNEDNADENTLLVPNIYNIIDAHISIRDKHMGQIVYTAFHKNCQLLSNSQTDLMLDMLFETGDLKEQLELEKFKSLRYYSFFANDSNGSYTLVLNADKKVIAQILVDIMINVYSHPKGKFLKASTEFF